MKSSRIIVLAGVLAVFAATSASADFDTGWNYFKSGKYLEAASEFQTLVDETPDWADGHALLGACFMKMDKPAEAEKSFLKAIELDPDKFEYRYNLATTQQASKQYAKAVGTLNSAEDLADPSQKLLVYKLRGNALAAQKKWEEAVVDLENACKIDADGTTQLQLGKAYFALGDNQAAVTALRKAAKIQPTGDAYNLIAEALLNLAAKSSSDTEKARRYDEALQEAENYLAVTKSTDARYLVGRAALGASQFDKAIDLFNQVLQKEADNCNAMANMGKAYTAKQDWNNALAALDNATKCDASMGLAWENKGFVLRKMASGLKKQPAAQQIKYTDAIKAYEMAQQIKPTPAITKAISDCEQNLKISKENQAITQAEAEQEKAIAEEEKRVAEAKAKQEAWKAKQQDDD